MLVYRVLASFGYAAIAVVVAVTFPVASFMVWERFSPGIFGNEYKELLPLILMIWGAIMGAVIGLIAGAAMPNRRGLGITFLGLGLAQTAPGIYFWIVASGDTHIALIALILPVITLEFLAGSILCIRRKQHLKL